MLLAAKKQIEADEKEIDALEAKHVESVAAWKTEIEKLRGDEAQQRLRAELAERLVENMGIQCASDLHNARHEILELKQRNMILEQGKQLVLMQFSNDILTLLSEFGYATREKGYDSPSLVLSDLRDCMSKLRNGAIAEYQLRVKAERGGRHGRIKSGD